MAEKSISMDSFTCFLSQFPEYLFVDLQYGDSSKAVEAWLSNNIKIFANTSINPLTSMDDWLSLVDKCDAVLSVANTTIHGAASLNKPTMCLLSRKPDWRWLDDRSIQRSYWYKSVSVARQAACGSWDDALKRSKEWIHRGCPSPVGPYC